MCLSRLFFELVGCYDVAGKRGMVSVTIEQRAARLKINARSTADKPADRADI